MTTTDEYEMNADAFRNLVVSYCILLLVYAKYMCWVEVYEVTLVKLISALFWKENKTCTPLFQLW